MNNIKTIAKYHFKEAFFPYYPSKKAPNMPNNYFLRVILFIFTYLTLSFIVFSLMNALAGTFLVGEGGESMYFTFFGMIIVMMIFVFYIPKILSDFFSDKKINIYKTLPVGEGELFIGKLLGEIGSFVDYFLFLFITLGIYFSHKGFSIPVLVLGLLNFFGLIIVPNCILTLIILLIMRFTNAGSHRKFFKNLGYVMLLIVTGIIYFYAYGGGGNSMEEFESATISRTIDNLSGISNIFFNAKIFGQSLGGDISQKLIYTLILMGVSALFLFVTYKLADKFYYDSLSEKEGSANKKKQLSLSDKDFKSLSQFAAIFKRDIKNLFSNMVFIYPAASMIMIFGILGFTTGKRLVLDLETLEFVSVEIRLAIFLIGFALGLLMWVNVGLTNTSLSREHKSFYLFQTIPIDPISHFKARVLSGVLVTGGFNLILCIIYGLVFKFGLVNSIILFLGMMVASLTASFEGLYVGSKNIKTNWTKPEEINKGNVKNILYYILSLVVVVALVGVFIFTLKLTDNFYLAGAVDILIIIIITALMASLSIKSYKKGFYDIND